MVARKRFLAAALSACALASALPGAAGAAPADLDRGFSGDGIVRVVGGEGATFGREASARMAVGPRDEVLVLYSNHAPCDPPFDCTVDLALARYDPAGKRDTSFGVGSGSKLTVRQFTERQAFDLAVGPDGKAVVVASDHAVPGVRVARFGLDGRLDGTFGSGGVAPQPADVDTDTTLAVVVQPDGKIVVAGSGSRVEGGEELVLVRYLPSGELDAGFGSGGKVVVALPTQTRPADLLLDPAGRLTAVAPRCCVGGTPLFGGGFSLARFLSDGRPDPAFGGTGQVFFPTPSAEGGVEAAALAPNGGVFTVFEESTEVVSTVGNVVKLSPGGSVATSFGREGRLFLYQRVGSVDPRHLVVDGSGRLVGAGWGEGKVAVFRLRADGSIDRTFNGGQQVTAPAGFVPLGLGLQSSGRIVVLGNRGCCGPQSFVLIVLRGGTDRTRCQGRKATIVGTRRKDELTGTPRRDVIAALGGNDTVRGMSGADLICGGIGKDRLLGGAGRDSVQQQPGGSLTR